MNGHLSGRNTGPERKTHNKEHPACSQRTWQLQAPINALHLLSRRTGLKLGEMNRINACFVLNSGMMKTQENTSPEGGYSGFYAVLLLCHSWRALNFEALPASKWKNYYLVYFTAIISDLKLGKVCLRSYGKNVEREAFELRQKDWKRGLEPEKISCHKSL